MSNFEVVKKWWFSTLRGTIGIIEVKDKLTRENFYYIGIIDGSNVEEDIKKILDFGQKFHPIDLL